MGFEREKPHTNKPVKKTIICYRKEEYMSPAGLALLFDRAGGSLNETMRDVIVTMESNSPHADRLISEVRVIWDTWDAQEEEEYQDDDMLKYDSFYNGFMAPYFGCYRCSDTKKARSITTIYFTCKTILYYFSIMTHGADIAPAHLIYYLRWRPNQLTIT